MVKIDPQDQFEYYPQIILVFRVIAIRIIRVSASQQEKEKGVGSNMDERLEMSSSNFGIEIQRPKTFNFLLTSHLQKLQVRLKGKEPKAHTAYYVVQVPVADSDLNIKIIGCQ